jgi:HAMP domain-containing protein
MVQEEQRLLEVTRLLANTEGVAEALSSGQAETLRTLTFGMTVNQQVEAVEFLDAKGDLLLSMRHVPEGREEEYSFSKNGGAAFLEWGFISNVQRQERDALGDKFSGLVRAAWGDYFYVAAPVTGAEGEFAGVVLAGITLDSLGRSLHEAAMAQVTFYTAEGEVVRSTLVGPTAFPSTEIPVLLARQDHESHLRDLPAQRQLDMVGFPYLEIVGPWEIRGGEDVGLLGISMMQSYLIQASAWTRFQIALLVGAALIVVVLTGIVTADRITRPLFGLVKASREVSQGNLRVQVVPESNDEVALLARSFNSMVAGLDRSRQELTQAYDRTLEGWVRVLEMRDKITEGHTRRVEEMTVRMGREFGLTSEADVINLRRGAMLHDIGKMGIADKILQKPGPLSEEEWSQMRRHPCYAYDLLSPITYLHPALDIPRYHHERWDGTGYPSGLRGSAIPLPARIFAVVDVWDAVTSDRPYRQAMSKAEALEIIRSGSGSHFDPRVVVAFLKLIEETEVLPADDR